MFVYCTASIAIQSKKDEKLNKRTMTISLHITYGNTTSLLCRCFKCIHNVRDINFLLEYIVINSVINEKSTHILLLHTQLAS